MDPRGGEYSLQNCKPLEAIKLVLLLLEVLCFLFRDLISFNEECVDLERDRDLDLRSTAFNFDLCFECGGNGGDLRGGFPYLFLEIKYRGTPSGNISTIGVKVSILTG